VTRLFLLVALLSLPAFSEAHVTYNENPPPTFDWAQPTPLEIAAFVAADSLIWIDVLQSVSAPADWVEYNPILGKHPSNTKMVLLGGLAPSLVLGAIWYALPSGWRYAVPVCMVGAELPVVIRNHEVGLRIHF
jgi:hypothetical protein